MPVKHGVFVNEQATSVSTPIVADCGIPFVIGTAPYHCGVNGIEAGLPIICTSWSEFVDNFGYSDDWKSYTLCEFAYSHFKLFEVQPAIFCTIPAAETEVVGKAYTVSNRKVTLPFGAAVIKSVKNGDTALKEDEYTFYYTETAAVIELRTDSANASATELTVDFTEYSFEGKTAEDIIKHMDALDACMSEVGVIPDLICAPGFSHSSELAAIMAAKAAELNGVFKCKALIDVSDDVPKYSDVYAWKTQNNIVDENQIVCFPKLGLGERVFHQSTQLAGLMAQIDAGNGTPYESPSNKNYQMDRLVVGADNKTLRQTKAQADILNGYGVVTALNFLSSGWVCWGNYTACYPANSDVKDYFIPVSRMFDWVSNTLVRTFWSKLDLPMNRRLIETIIDSCNIWLNGLVGRGFLLGGRAELIEAENPASDLMAGIMRVHIYLTPPSPAQEIDFTLEYDVNYVKALYTQEEG